MYFKTFLIVQKYICDTNYRFQEADSAQVFPKYAETLYSMLRKQFRQDFKNKLRHSSRLAVIPYLQERKNADSFITFGRDISQTVSRVTYNIKLHSCNTAIMPCSKSYCVKTLIRNNNELTKRTKYFCILRGILLELMTNQWHIPCLIK